MGERVVMAVEKNFDFQALNIINEGTTVSVTGSLDNHTFEIYLAPSGIIIGKFDENDELLYTSVYNWEEVEKNGS